MVEGMVVPGAAVASVVDAIGKGMLKSVGTSHSSFDYSTAALFLIPWK
jgi:hypothetical protein